MSAGKYDARNGLTNVGSVSTRVRRHGSLANQWLVFDLTIAAANESEQLLRAEGVVVNLSAVEQSSQQPEQLEQSHLGVATCVMSQLIIDTG